MFLRKAFHYARNILLGLVSLITLYFALALILSLIPSGSGNLNCDKNKSIFIASNGVHVDIIIAVNEMDSVCSRAFELTPDVKYLAFGWGDKGFYLETPTWADLKLSTAFKAMFLPSETAMHVTRYKQKRNHWLEIRVCEKQLVSLLDHIENSFQKNENKEIIEIENAGYTTFDTFYEAKGAYNCIRTCNQWTNKALKTAGIRTSVWSPFDKGVIFHIKKNHL